MAPPGRRSAHEPEEMPVETAEGGIPHGGGDLRDAVRRGQQHGAAGGDAHLVQEIQRRGAELLQEQAAEVRRTQVAQLRQGLNIEIFRVIRTDVIERGCQDPGTGLDARVFLWRGTQQVDRHGEKEPADAGFVAGFAVHHLADEAGDEGFRPGIGIRTEHQAAVDDQLGEVLVVRKLQGHAVQQAGIIHKQVAPQAVGIRGGPGGVVHMGRDKGDGALGEGKVILADDHFPAAAAADADFHAVVEMQPRALHRADEPVVPVQGKDREICRKLIIPVFRKDDPRSGHGAAPPVMLSAMQQNHYTPHGEK